MKIRPARAVAAACLAVRAVRFGNNQPVTFERRDLLPAS